MTSGVYSPHPNTSEACLAGQASSALFVHQVLDPRTRRTIGWHCLPNATCLIRPHLFYAPFSVKDHHSLPKYSSLLKSACVRQVVLTVRRAVPPDSSTLVDQALDSGPRGTSSSSNNNIVVMSMINDISSSNNNNER